MITQCPVRLIQTVFSFTEETRRSESRLENIPEIRPYTSSDFERLALAYVGSYHANYGADSTSIESARIQLRNMLVRYNPDGDSPTSVLVVDNGVGEPFSGFIVALPFRYSPQQSRQSYQFARDEAYLVNAVYITDSLNRAATTQLLYDQMSRITAAKGFRFLVQRVGTWEQADANLLQASGFELVHGGNGSAFRESFWVRIVSGAERQLKLEWAE